MATLTSTASGPGNELLLEGRITAYTAAPIWRSAIDTLARNPDRPDVVDAPASIFASTC